MKVEVVLVDPRNTLFKRTGEQPFLLDDSKEAVLAAIRGKLIRKTGRKPDKKEAATSD